MPDAPTAPHALPHSRLLQAVADQTALRALRGRLARAGRRGHPAGAALEALARLDPDEAVAWLLEAGPAVADLLSDADLRRVVDRVADEAAARGDAGLAERAAGALPPDAAPDTLVALAAALPRERHADVLGARVQRSLDRRPGHPGLLRLAAGMAADRGDPAAHPLLDRLGHADPSPATAQWIFRARDALPPGEGPPARVALLSSFTIEPLRPYLDLELRAAGMTPHLYVAPFGAWERETRDPDAGLRGFGADAVFLSAHLDDLVPALAGASSPDALRRAGDQAVERIAAAAAALRAWSDAPLVVHSLHTAHPDPLGPAAGREGASRQAWVRELNARLEGRLFDFPAAYLLDVDDLLARRPGGAPEEPKLRHLARMRLGHALLPELARACAGYLAPLKGLTRKCVVVDLDGTLWGGVVGEDGPAGIRLGDTSPGSEYVEFQRWLATLPARGILLAAVSKNNADDALEAIRRHPAMVLREDDFSALRIDWAPKHENVLAVAGQLGIGVSSMVFVDDNPDERALMRTLLPEVLTPELPGDPALYRAALERLPQLRTLRVTDEDRDRADRYRARAERERARSGAASLDGFLRSLDLAAEAAPAGRAALPRVAQLFARTSQFNLTTRRHDEALLALRAADPGWRLWTLAAADRYSDHGLVGAALVRAGDGAWTVESLLLSCRAIGYGLESALLAAVCRDARAAGAARLEGEFVETAKNRPAAGFWARHGFTLRERVDGVERWERGIAAEGVAVPDWIRLTVRDAA